MVGSFCFGRNFLLVRRSNRFDATYSVSMNRFKHTTLYQTKAPRLSTRLPDRTGRYLLRKDLVRSCGQSYGQIKNRSEQSNRFSFIRLFQRDKSIEDRLIHPEMFILVNQSRTLYPLLIERKSPHVLPIFIYLNKFTVDSLDCFIHDFIITTFCT